MNSKTGSLVVAIVTIATAPAPPMAEHSHQRHPTNQTPPLQTDADWIRAGEIVFNAPLSALIGVHRWLPGFQVGGTS